MTIEQLIGAERAKLGLSVVAGERGLERAILVPRIQKPGLALTGYTEQLHTNRLLVVGSTEIEYLESVSEEQLRTGVRTVMASVPACVVVTRGLRAPPVLLAACEDEGVPLLSTELQSADFIARVTSYLQSQMAPSTSVHGVLLDVLGIGILLLGKSGIGKSEIALELITRGHRLIADDIVTIRQRSANLVYGSGSGIIRHHMEIRGLGIINIKDLFGISSVREAKKIELVIELAEWDEHEEYDRLGLDDHFYSVLGVDIPMLRLPVRPGRTMATIIEVAARNQMLKFQGHHSAREFQEKLNRAIAEARPSSYDIDVIE
ncbi:HPr(Ser) kinase/phosphatase [Haliangium ochraceum]|uniref:HPr(Ser) kinase/phosphatase n=1 Tax=Haliangium ochraceum TaxID=80816 RepID=UPI000315CC40|nr:HPr(Ser) kinase/phosphatase [Haliangium ochraceum]